MPDLVYYAIPAFFALMLLEAWLSARVGADAYERRDTAASLSMGVGNVVVNAGVKTAIAWPLFAWIYAHRLFEIGSGPRAWILLFFAEDLTYYVWHRASHEVRLLWAAHENHHSSQRFNLSTALRQSWTTPFTTLPFYVALPLLGFHPLMVATEVSVSLLYQFWIHTERIGRLPAWYELVFNTPSHHRVHHGANVEYLDRNHGGILILWDRLFGSFEPERAPVRYGLTKNLSSFNPFRIAFHEFVSMFRAAGVARSWREAAGYLLRPPGWSPDGSSRTAAELQAALRATGYRA